MEGQARKNREPSCNYTTINGAEFCYFRWNQSAKHLVLLVHATGFHARCWDVTIAELGSDFQVIAMDMRGHGRSEKKSPYDWLTFGKDVVSLLETLDLVDVVGVGHSMGGYSLTQACAASPRRFKGLVLVDPVIFPTAFYGETAVPNQVNSVDSHPVARRRNEWASPKEMFDNLEQRHPFSLWKKDCLWDYCRWGLLANEEGKFELACPPRVEASIYMGSRVTDIGRLCKTISHPVVVMRAPAPNPDSQSLDFSKSPTRADLHEQFERGEDRYLSDLTHFIPMQRPDLVAQEIIRLAKLRKPRVDSD